MQFRTERVTYLTIRLRVASRLIVKGENAVFKDSTGFHFSPFFHMLIYLFMYSFIYFFVSMMGIRLSRNIGT